MIVPVSIAGKSRTMLLDTGGVISELSPSIVKELNLPTRHTNLILYDISGDAVDEVVNVQNFVLGTLRADNMQLFVAHTDLDEADGILAPNILGAYDIEMDFKNNKLSFFSQDHCKGQVIHWPADVVALVPMRLTEGGHIVVSVQVDGRRLNGLIDTGASQTAMSLRIATGRFGLQPDKDMQEVDTLRRPGSKVYGHRFQTLTLEGITVNNPYMAIIPDLNRERTRKPPKLGTRLPTNRDPPGLGDVIIGMSVLKHLHVYIAYKEQALYITPAK